MNPSPSAQNPISQPLKKANPSSHFTPSRPSFKTGAQASEWNVEEILSSLYWLFVDSPARKDFTESMVFPLKFCKHRWLETVPVLLRAQEIWASHDVCSKSADWQDIRYPNSKIIQDHTRCCPESTHASKNGSFRVNGKAASTLLGNFSK